MLIHVNEENIKFILALKINQLRSSMGLSLKEVSKLSGLSVSYLNQIETGKKYPKVDKLMALARVFDTTYDYLTSLELGNELAPISKILKSNLLSHIPFGEFGIDIGKIFDILSGSPKTSGAFITTFFEMATQHRIELSDFYLSSLRSYLEIHKNYFRKVEIKSRLLAKSLKFDYQDKQETLFNILKCELESNYRYHITEKDFSPFSSIRYKKSVYTLYRAKHNLVLNKNSQICQKLYALALELGYQLLGVKKRPKVYPDSFYNVLPFNELLQNYEATYFAAALLIPSGAIVKDVNALFQSDYWDKKSFLKMKQRYPVSKETFIHRITSILPRFFGVNDLFFLKLVNTNDQNLILNKELHIGGVQGAHSSVFNEHYCRRWTSSKLFDTLEDESEEIITQISKYHLSDKKYFCISLLKTKSVSSKYNSCITLGIKLNENTSTLKHFVKNEDEIKVGVTCERCLMENCKERIAESSVLKRLEQEKQFQQDLLKFKAT